MIKLYFQKQGKTKFVEISPETHEQLRLHSYKLGLSLQQVTEMIYDQYGDMSEKLITQYLNLMAKREKNKRVCTKKNPFIPPAKENESWEHVDAFQTDPPEYDGSFPNFHCPNCGFDFTMDFR